MNIHTAYIMYAIISTLDEPVTLKLEAQDRDGLNAFIQCTLRELLIKQKHSNKYLFRAIAMQENSSIMVIVCRGDGRDDVMANIAGDTAVWTMFKLLLKHGATAESVDGFPTACFSAMHVRAATDFGKYKPETGSVTLVKDFEGE